MKDPEEAQIFLSLQEKGALPTDSQEKEREHEVSQNVVTIEDRKDDASVKNEELKLTNERFLVPEMLFHPADLGNFLLQKPNFYC